MNSTLRHSLLSLLGLCLGISVLKAAPVSVDSAKDEVMEFISSSGIMKTPGNATSTDVFLAETYASDSTNCFYIFNVNGGFVIISADNRLPQVLGYSENGAFDASGIPENMKYWLEGYRDEIAAALPYLPESDSNLRKSVRAVTRAAISPLVATQWNQDTPYNNNCPIDTSTGERSATGCVATAMAQIMKYHNWPDQPEGSNGGVTFTGTTYDWARMLDVYEEGKYSSAESSAVATLMYQVGKSVNMQYSSYASGAYDYDVQLALPKYFKYSQGLTFYWKDYTLQREWNNIIYAELAAGRPVYYSGSSSQGGHAFVCDGYSENEYFHFNWGWGGYEDGYFLLSALNPASGGTGSYEAGYNSNQCILTGIMPVSQNPDATTQVALLATGGFYYDYSNGGCFTVKNGSYDTNLMYNPLGFTEMLNIGIKLEDEDGNATYLTAGSKISLDSYYGISSMSVDFPSLSDGTYKITPVICLSGTSNWIPVGIPLGEQNYVKLVVSNSVLFFYNEGPDSDYTPKLIVGTPQFTKTVYSGTSIPVRIPVLNVGEGDFNAQIGISLFDANNDFGDIVSYQDNLAVAAKSFTYLDVTLDKLSAATYKASMMDVNNNTYFENFKITVKDGNFTAPSGNVTVTDISPSFYTSDEESPIYFTLANTSSDTQTVRFTFELLDMNSLTTLSNSFPGYSVQVPAKYTGRISITPFDLGIEPGEYLWRVISYDEKTPLSVPAPLVVTSARINSGGLTYIVTDEAAGKAILAAPEGDPYSGVVTVEDTIDGYEITALCNDAFAFATATEVTLPENITNIPAGCFYDDSKLTLLTMESETLVTTGSEAFNKDNTSGKCWINVNEDLANTFRYSSTSTWRGFLQPRWNLELTDVTIASGFNDISMLGDNNQYCVNPYSTPEISFSAPAGKNIRITVIDANKNWVIDQTIASGDVINLPELGTKGVGRIVALATTDEVSVDTVEETGDEVLDIYSIDGKIILLNSTPEERGKLSKGIYILSNGKKLIVR